MTVTQFRASPPLVIRLREILQDPTMQEALMALHDSNLPVEPADAEDAIASVRRHSRGVGFNACLATLLMMGQPVALATPEEESTYEPQND